MGGGRGDREYPESYGWKRHKPWSAQQVVATLSPQGLGSHTGVNLSELWDVNIKARDQT